MPWPWLWWTGQGSPSQVWAGWSPLDNNIVFVVIMIIVMVIIISMIMMIIIIMMMICSHAIGH